MSSDVSLTCVLAVSPEDLPSVMKEAGKADILNVPAAPLVVYGSTKAGMALDVAQKILHAAQRTGLDFLGGQGGRKIQLEDRLRHLVVLRNGELHQAASDMRRLLGHLAAAPRTAMDHCPGFLDEEQFVNALTRDYTASSRSINLNAALEMDDEGDGDEYVCAYLKSTLEVLLSAQAQKMVFVHATDWWGVYGWPQELALEQTVRIPERFHAGLGFAPDSLQLADLRLADGRVLFSVRVFNWVIEKGTSASGDSIQLGFEADDIVEVRRARSNLKTLLGMW